MTPRLVTTRAYKTSESARKARRNDYWRHAEERRAKERARYWKRKNAAANP